MGTALTLEQFEGDADLLDLLRAADGLTAVAPRPATFLELTGHAHLEAIISNLLAFFLNPSADHGLGHLFLDALMADLAPNSLSVTSVDSEVTTTSGKRLDLVIDADTHVVGIENKVLAGVYNPWDEYWRHLRALADSTGREPLLLLLVVQAPDALQVPDFVSVLTYQDLVSRAREMFGKHVRGVPAQYVTFALDFITTMENRYARKTMNPKMLELLREHPTAALEVADGVKRFSMLAAEKTGQLQSVVMEALGEAPPRLVQPRGFSVRLRRCQVFEVKFPNASVAVDVYLTPDGWEISVHERSEPNGGKGPMQTWLEGLPLPSGPRAGGLTVEDYARIVSARFPFETHVETVAEHVVEVLVVVASEAVAPATP